MLPNRGYVTFSELRRELVSVLARNCTSSNFMSLNNRLETIKACHLEHDDTILLETANGQVTSFEIASSY